MVSDHNQVVYASCKVDDPRPLQDILNNCETITRSGVLSTALSYGVSTHALSVLRLALEAGADCSHVAPNAVITHGHQRILNRDLVLLLQSYGWDINFRRHKGWPLLWMLAGDATLAQWCVQQGAKVDLSPVLDTPTSNLGRTGREVTLLERVLYDGGGLDLFKQFRQQGAPLKPLCLHVAAKMACTSDQKAHEKLEVLQYLLTEEKLGVNDMDISPQDYHTDYNNDYIGGPLAYCIFTSDKGVDALKLLLEYGADPTLQPEFGDEQFGNREKKGYSAWAMAQARKDPETTNFIKTVEAFAREHEQYVVENWANRLNTESEKGENQSLRR